MLVEMENEYQDDNGFWQGVYVFNITLSNGFILKGNITHLDDSTDKWDNNFWIKRSLYIDDFLYTISNKKIKINNLEDLVLFKEIELS